MTRARLRSLFVRLLGLVFVAAFASLGVQVAVLFGSHGLLPACPVAPFAGPTLFALHCSDAALVWGTVAGATLGMALALGVLPRWTLLGCWVLYLSYVSVGQDFLSFQWDNLLLETALFTLLVTPGGWRLRDAPPPHPIAVFLMQWLLLRLHVESGAAKLLAGDPTWWDLTAMSTYYETAPLPTWVGWWAHQMPMWAHRACSLFTFVVELGVPWLMWGPRRLRVVAFALMAAMQVSVILTANYGFFNWLSLALCLWVLDDGHLAWLAARVGVRLRPVSPRPPSAWRTAALAVVAAVLVPLSLVPFLPFVSRDLARRLVPVRAVLDDLRSLNAYHLFARMTLVRDEVVIEGSNDGVTWLPYELRWKPGDVDRAPAFVAPHQPRVDFQLWFLLLGGRGIPPYLDTLLTRLLVEPDAVASLFARNPFPDGPPRELRLAVWRYRFSDRATRAATGAWWTRELSGHSRTFRRP